MSTPAVARSTVISGPGIVTFDGRDYVTEGDIEVVTRIDTNPIVTSAYGPVDHRVKNVVSTITFTPIGTLNNIVGLFPYQPFLIGSSIFGGLDRDVQVRSLVSGQGGIYLKSAAVTQCPTLTFSTQKPLLGACTITAIGSVLDNTQRVAIPSGIPVGSYTPSEILTVSYGISGCGFSNVETVDGFTVQVSPSFKNIEVDAYGLVDMRLMSVDVTCRFRPLNLTDYQLISLMARTGVNNLKTGTSLFSVGETVTISPTSGTGFQFNILNAVSVLGGGMYGLGQTRGNEVELRGFLASAESNLYSLGVLVGSGGNSVVVTPGPDIESYFELIGSDLQPKEEFILNPGDFELAEEDGELELMALEGSISGGVFETDGSGDIQPV